MADEKKQKDLKDLKTWDDDLANIRPSKETLRQPKPAAPKIATQDASKLTEQVENEWEAKIREAKKGDKALIKVPGKPETAFASIDQVFETLKKDDGKQPVIKSKVGEKRLDKISGTIMGEAPEIRERDLTGQTITGVYTLQSLGSVPPFNLLSKAMYSLSSSSLERDLQNAHISLYPEEYANFSVAIGLIFALLLFAMLLLLMWPSFLLPILAFFLSIFLLSFLVVNLPSIQVKSGSSDVDKQLPFALRHMSALLSAGISIFDAIVSVSKTDYGHLSKELDKVVWDVKSGENLSDALDEASHRIGSHPFMRVTIHVRRALQMGGDVSKIISQIADDMSFEMRMKVSDFVEKLNAFAIVYIIGGIVGPVVISVFSVVGSAGAMKTQGMASGIDQFSLLFLLILVFPLVMALIAFIIHAMEPKV